MTGWGQVHRMEAVDETMAVSHRERPGAGGSAGTWALLPHSPWAPAAPHIQHGLDGMSDKSC